MEKRKFNIPKIKTIKTLLPKGKKTTILSKIRYDILAKGLFVFVFTVACLLILLPQIDYQEWYPNKFRTFDFNLSLDFKEHKKAEIDFSENQLSKEQQREYIEEIYRRVAESGIEDFYLEKNSKTITIHLPSSYSEGYIKTLLAQGEIVIKKPIEELDFEENIGQMFEESSYTNTDIDQSRIQDATLISENENYSFIEIVTDPEQVEIWNQTVKDSEQNNIATIINGDLNLSWIASTTETQREYPILLLMSGRPDQELIINQLSSKPLSFKLPNPEIKTIPSIYSDESLYILSASILLSFVAALIFKILIQKQSIRQITIVGVMVLGLLTVLKLQAISLSLVSLLIICVIVAALSLLPIKFELFLAVIFTITGIVFKQAENPMLSESSILLTTSAAYSFIFFIICFFLDLYED